MSVVGKRETRVERSQRLQVEEFRRSVIKMDAVELLGLLRLFNLANRLDTPEEIAESVQTMIERYGDMNRKQRRNLLRVVKAAVR